MKARSFYESHVLTNLRQTAPRLMAALQETGELVSTVESLAESMEQMFLSNRKAMGPEAALNLSVREAILEPLPKGRKGSGSARGVNYRLTEADALHEGGAKTKFRRNIDAIRLLKQIESEGRLATPDEQKVLVRYIGWGGIPQPFAEQPRDNWAREARELRELLTEDEFVSARASTPNAHFTPPEVIQAVWEGVRGLGFSGGHVQEPSAGIGHFIGGMPDDLASASSVAAIELDDLSHRILRQLYQQADVRQGAYQALHTPDKHFDVTISNIPFASVSIADGIDRDLGALRAPLHDYFIAKMIRKTRPGGLTVVVTSRFSMDKKNSKYRRAWDREADFIGAVRLPAKAIGTVSPTDVVADVLVFQKRADGQASRSEPFTAHGGITRGSKKFEINEYFIAHQDHVLGRMSDEGTMRQAGEFTVVRTDPPEVVMERMREIIEGLPRRPRRPRGDVRPHRRRRAGLHRRVQHRRGPPAGPQPCDRRGRRRPREAGRQARRGR